MKLTASSNITVVVPEAAMRTEEFAAEELRKYLQLIFPGISVHCVADTATVAGDRFLIGGPERNSAVAAYISEADFDAQVPGPEGMFIKAYGENVLILAGSSKNVNERARGTVYAVYELLERYLGCSLAAYVNPDITGGELIPVMDEVDLFGIEHIKPCADNSYRTAIAEYHGRKVDQLLNRSFIDWLAKNRYNRILTWNNVYEKYKAAGLVEEVERRGILLSVGHHDAIRTFLPAEGNSYFPEHYYQTHPEYYRLTEDNTRYHVVDHWGSWALCSRNPDLPGVIARNIISWIEQNPNVDTIAFWPLDGKASNCTCPECSKYDKVENYAYFQNAVASVIGTAHPEIKIDMLSYSAMSDCPNNLKLAPNLFIDKALWHHTGLRNIGKADGSGINHTFFEEDLLKWKQAGAHVVYYDYYMGVHSARQRYIPAADEMQSIWKRFTELGIDGSGTQIEYFNFWNHIFNFYCFARTGYDTTLSLEAHLAKFTQVFGEGASAIAQIIRLAESCLDGQVNIGKAGLYVMDHLDKPRIYALFDQALNAAQTPAARNNIRMLRMGFRYSDIECANTTIGKVAQAHTPLESCSDPTGELYYMSHNFDSSNWNNPGFGIMLPLDCQKEAEFTPDRWYSFEA